MKRLSIQVAVLALALWSAACGSSAGKCRPGERGCACIQQTCQAGLVCTSGACVPEAVVGLTVSDSHARGCEVLLGDGGGKIDHVTFGSSVTGRWLRQGDKVSAAFVANRDAPMSGGVEVAFAGAGAFSVLASHCYGARGEVLPNATVSR